MAMSQSENETARIAIIAAAGTSAIWAYDQFKLSEGINIMMVLCTIFIISSLFYLMSTGYMLATNNPKSIKIKLIERCKNFSYKFTIKYFWYTFFCLIYLLIASALNISAQTAINIATIFTISFGILAITSLFKKPQRILEKILSKLFKE